MLPVKLAEPEYPAMSTTISLSSRVQYLPGVGPERAELLGKLGVERAADLLFLFPRGYEDVALGLSASEFAENLRVSAVGTIIELGERITHSGKHMLGVHVRSEDGAEIRLLWFNQAFRLKAFHPGQRLCATGILKSTGINWEMVHPEIQLLDAGENPDSQRPLPIYPLTEGLKQSYLRKLLRRLVPELASEVEEALPDWLRRQLDVPDIRRALQNIHLPETLEQAYQAQRRFKLQELLVLQLAIAMQRQAREQSATALQCPPSGKVHARILNRLEVQLTPDQVTAIDEVAADMARPTPMNRLLQGDVGSGKTIVAQYAMLLCVAHGYQAALMAPTEVLARQHFRTLGVSLRASSVRMALLTGTMPSGERQSTLRKLADGQIDLIIGTQALLSDKLTFDQLALVIVDEQHKFGVLQRAKLRTESQQPHYLVLSATPIPRTIAMTAFGDLDVSTIRTKPPGRAPVHTYTATPDQLPDWWRFVAKQVALGRQAYVIAPRVGEADGEEVANATGIYKELRSGSLNQLSIGLLHGRLPSVEKDAVLERFAAGQLHVLVATTVVEVGIDVPNATVMTILDADRLGLAQLHQLRGRISRGTHPGFVCAVAVDSRGRSSESQLASRSGGAADGVEPSNLPNLLGAAQPAAAENPRLEAFRRTDDGFELAEVDLKLRGPGDLLGTSQSGLPTLRIANLAEDHELLELARQAARQVLEEDPLLQAPELSRLVKQTLNRYGKSMQLSDIG